MLNPTSKSYLRSLAKAGPMGMAQVISLKHGLRLEVNTGGRMKLTAKAPKASTLARRWMGIKGNREALLAQVEHIAAVAERYRRLLPRWAGRAAQDKLLREAREGQVWLYRDAIFAKLYGEVQVIATGLREIPGTSKLEYLDPASGERRVGGPLDVLQAYGFEADPA